MHEQHAREQAVMDRIVAGADAPESAVRAWVDALATEVNQAEFRGCAFLNAAAEYHDPPRPGPAGRRHAPRLVHGATG
ncbi:hypothetical protein [Curtobacterium sp. MCPF17_052]|uniref:hypothetical protein n=1 Tax=Curtobacterium sp. MCPF17_052 TaxID=2175655 RepID=UPI0024DFD696|nr:hypothetical protein [Curtobacterium sp. MCPF17_052]WIB12213.1 hypothetical protein DEJ36_15975 [Curtobacterium sp. MCPF17_052]